MDPFRDEPARRARRLRLAALVVALCFGACSPSAPPAVEMGDRATIFPPQEVDCQDIVGDLYRNTSGREVGVHLQILDTCRRRDGQGIRSRFTLTDSDGGTRRQEYVRQLGSPTALSFVLRPEETIRLDTGGKRGEGRLTYVLGLEIRSEEVGDGQPRDGRPAEPGEASGASPETTATDGS